jgi:hypothetical protein
LHKKTASSSPSLFRLTIPAQKNIAQNNLDLFVTWRRCKLLIVFAVKWLFYI